MKWYTSNTLFFAVSLTNHFLPSEIKDLELLTVTLSFCQYIPANFAASVSYDYSSATTTTKNYVQ
jgi:hypothetical protein